MDKDEIAARAIAAHKRNCSLSHPDVERVWTSYLGQARAALTAAEPFLAQVREEAFEEAAKRARGMLLWRLKGHPLRETLPDRIAEDVLSLKRRTLSKHDRNEGGDDGE
jgi:hypothetical protein